MAELFQAPDLLSLIFSPQEYPEKGGVTGFAEGFMGAFGAGMMGAPAAAPTGTTTVGGMGGMSYAPGMTGFGGKTGGTPGVGSVSGGGMSKPSFMNMFQQGLGGGGGGGGGLPQFGQSSGMGRAPTDNPSRALSGGGAYSREPVMISAAPTIPESPDYMLGGLPNINRLFDSIQRQIG